MTPQEDTDTTEQVSTPSSVPVAQRKGSFIGTFKAISWAFFGVRKNSDYQKDLEKLNPLHIMAVAIVMVMLMVGGLIFLVNIVVAK